MSFEFLTNLDNVAFARVPMTTTLVMRRCAQNTAAATQHRKIETQTSAIQKALDVLLLPVSVVIASCVAPICGSAGGLGIGPGEIGGGGGATMSRIVRSFEVIVSAVVEVAFNATDNSPAERVVSRMAAAVTAALLAASLIVMVACTCTLAARSARTIEHSGSWHSSTD